MSLDSATQMGIDMQSLCVRASCQVLIENHLPSPVPKPGLWKERSDTLYYMSESANDYKEITSYDGSVMLLRETQVALGSNINK